MLWKRRSILQTLLVSIAGAALLAYLVTRLLIPENAAYGLSLRDRLTSEYLLARLNDAWRPLAVFVLISMAGIWLVLCKVLAPIKELSLQARRIGPANLNERLPLARAPVELAPLVHAFNASLDRLEEAWKSQRSFSANAAHELRTPLAALRAQVESLLGPEERKQAVAEFDRLSRTINQLLILADGEHNPQRRSDPFDLAALALATASQTAAEFVQSGRRIEMIRPERVILCLGDYVLVGLAIRNLLENTLRHTPVGSTTTVMFDDQGVLHVLDDGDGVAPEFAARAFEPFSRGDPHGAGAGLGLSIVSRIAMAHGGRAWLADRSSGACFCLQLPLADDTERSRSV